MLDLLARSKGTRVQTAPHLLHHRLPPGALIAMAQLGGRLRSWRFGRAQLCTSPSYLPGLFGYHEDACMVLHRVGALRTISDGLQACPNYASQLLFWLCCPPTGRLENAQH